MNLKTKEEILNDYMLHRFVTINFPDATHENVLKAMQEYADSQVKLELLKFKEWYDKASPAQLVSLWSDDGSERGVFTMSDERVIDRFIEKYSKP